MTTPVSIFLLSIKLW